MAKYIAVQWDSCRSALRWPFLDKAVSWLINTMKHLKSPWLPSNSSYSYIPVKSWVCKPLWDKNNEPFISWADIHHSTYQVVGLPFELSSLQLSTCHSEAVGKQKPWVVSLKMKLNWKLDWKPCWVQLMLNQAARQDCHYNESTVGQTTQYFPPSHILNPGSMRNLRGASVTNQSILN